MTLEHMYIFTKDLVSGNLWRLLPTINVDKVKDIPCDYPGPMAVPITFMDVHNSDQFEIFDIIQHGRLSNGREPYKRIVIHNLKPALPKVIDLAEWFRRTGVMIDVENISKAESGEKIRIIYRGRRDQNT